MPSLVHRSATSADIPAAARLFVESVRDLALRNGLPDHAPSAESIEPWYQHLRETGLFEVAMEGDTLLSFAAGIVRDDLFFLSMFWTKPGRQGQGIGGPLLDRVWAQAEERGAAVFSVWSSIDFAALGTYLKRGMRPIGPVLTFGGTPKALEDILPAEVVPLDAAIASNVDQAVRGTARPVDHAFFMKEKSVARLVCRGAQTLGYFYAHEGRVGPAAWLDDRDARAVLGAAVREAALQTKSITLSIPGPNRLALDLAVDAGLRIEGSSHLLTSDLFGAIERYIPSGPALF